jgi:hypothetical protein
MRLPRWTVYPALAVLAAMLVLAFPHPQSDRHIGAATRARGDAGQGATHACTTSARETEASHWQPSFEGDAPVD